MTWGNDGWGERLYISLDSRKILIKGKVARDYLYDSRES